MTEIKNIDVPTLKPEVKIDKLSRQKLLNQVQEESQVIVHCTYTGSMNSDRIRIWASTFLYAKDSSHKSELIHIENITMYPIWMDVANGQTINFTLIFQDCQNIVSCLIWLKIFQSLEVLFLRTL
ncbi:MAG: hypothetical protein IPG55_05255 [Saprospiraceae bacterium]|nr:hypothetical protein [Candidatus Defluviibacterium haderslevense]